MTDSYVCRSCQRDVDADIERALSTTYAEADALFLFPDPAFRDQAAIPMPTVEWAASVLADIESLPEVAS